MSDKSMKLEQAMFILRHGSAEGEHKYFEAISVIEKAYNRLKAENKNCGVKIQFQREQLKACNEKIKRLEVDNEKLKRLEFQADALNEAYEESVREAVKEFAEKLIKEFSQCQREYRDVLNSDGACAMIIAKRVVNNLLQEMGCGE